MCVTAYDVLSARLAEEAEVDVILVGDSLGNVVLGYETTVPVTLEDMVHHTRAVARVVERAMVVADLPFGTYQVSQERGLDAAVALMQAGAQAVKLEGNYPDVIAALVRAGIPTMGHVGFTPQSVHVMGGFRVQGRGDQGDAVTDLALALQDAGAFALVLELIPGDLAQAITERLDVLTIGIGAGSGCDGQIQVFHDLLGLGSTSFRHAKRFVNGREYLLGGLKAYRDEVRAQTFPDETHTFQ